MSSKKCTSNPSPPSATTPIHVQLSNTWPASFPSGFTCSGTGPMIGNNPTYNNGSNSLYSSTNKRFTEVWIRDITTNAELSRKCWSTPEGNSGYEVVINAPTSHPYEVHFQQYYACSGACLRVGTSSGFKDTRLVWSKSITCNYLQTYITMTPQYSTYTICN